MKKKPKAPNIGIITYKIISNTYKKGTRVALTSNSSEISEY